MPVAAQSLSPPLATDSCSRALNGRKRTPLVGDHRHDPNVVLSQGVEGVVQARAQVRGDRNVAMELAHQGANLAPT